jgi:hypothetical protein
MILRALQPKYREKAMQWLQAAAMLAFCVAILLNRFVEDSPFVSLLSGILLGFSIVGNLISLYYRSHKPDKGD